MTKARREDFLDAIEKRLRRIERQTAAANVPKRRRVTFNTEVAARGFMKAAPPRDVQSPEFDESARLASSHSDSSASDEDFSEDMGDEDFGSEESGSGSSEQEESDLSMDEEAFDRMSPEEQLRMLSEPVSDEEYSESGESADEAEDTGSTSDNDASDDDGEFSDEEDSEDDDTKDHNGKDSKAKKSFLDEFDVDSDEDVEEAHRGSSFAIQQERLRKTISELESQSVSEKSWQFRGEVPAAMRPINSLLEQDVDFTQISRAAPPSTVELSDFLEKTIRQRILDRAWDDPVRRTAAEVAAMSRPAAAPRVDAAPDAPDVPRKSLADVYADEAAARMRPASETGPRQPADAKTRAAHEEITALFTKVCRKIDALSRFKFAPHYEPLAELSVAPDARFTKRQV